MPLLLADSVGWVERASLALAHHSIGDSMVGQRERSSLDPPYEYSTKPATARLLTATHVDRMLIAICFAATKGATISLVDLNLPNDVVELPRDVIAFLREADRRIERFQFDHHIPGFVPSDFPRAYRVLRSLAAAEVATGGLFCEWGSGYGVVTCLAAMLDFDAWGIEIEGELVDAARKLAKDFDLPAQFVRGSFIPKGSEVSLDDRHGFAWLTTEGEDLRDEMDLELDDFNVIFAYPWPDEERTVEDLFERHASEGAILFTCHENGTTQLRRKVKAKRR